MPLLALGHKMALSLLTLMLGGALATKPRATKRNATDNTVESADKILIGAAGPGFCVLNSVHRSSRVLRRARVFTPPLSSRPETRQTGKALDVADIGHHKEVADLMQCS